MKTKSNSEKSKNEKFRGLSKYVYIHYTYIYKLCVLFCICVLGKWQQQNSFYIRRTMVKDMYKCIYIYKKKHIIYNILKSVIKHFSIKVPFFGVRRLGTPLHLLFIFIFLSFIFPLYIYFLTLSLDFAVYFVFYIFIYLCILWLYTYTFHVIHNIYHTPFYIQ